MSDKFQNCYKLPWNESDNPNGWIEPTTECNITCPGCYRGADKVCHKPEHLPLEEVIKQIDWFIENRNIHTLSISGGDPLLYPQLTEVVEYAASKNIRVMIYTNGVALTSEMLIQLRNAGTTQFLVHIDKFQDRPDKSKGTSCEEHRQKFCDMFRKAGGIMLGFIQPLSDDYIEVLKSVSETSLKNADVVSLNVFTFYREICWEAHTKEEISTEVNMNKALDALWDINRFQPASYLGSEINESDPTWVFGTRAIFKSKSIGHFSPNLYKYAHQRYRNKKGKYMFISRYNSIKMLSLLALIRFSSVRKIWKNYLITLFNKSQGNSKKVNFQTVLLLRGPEKKSAEWDLCDGCPDRIIHNGRLVPSCILEDLKTNTNSNFKKVEFK